MSLNNKTAENGTFRKRQGFTMASNAAIRDRKLSLKARGLYTFIMSYATMPGLTLTKSFLATHCLEKERAFNSAWDELKTHGFLKVYFTPSGENNRWCVEYELLDVADPADGVHTYYYNLAGEVTATNLTRKAQRDNAEPAPEQQEDSRTPQNVGDAPRTLHYANVIDAINRNSDHCTEGGLSEFLEQTMDDFLNACENTEITDIRKYTKSLIWSSFSTYKVKLDAACLS